MNALLTSRDAAALLGVGVSSVNRWADAGLLECQRTVGGHRRFDRAVVEAFARDGAKAGANDVGTEEGHEGGEPSGASASGPRESAWIKHWLALLEPGEPGAGAGGSVERLCSELLALHAQEGAWLQVVERLCGVVEAIGLRWQHGHYTVSEEHLASEQLARGLARVSEQILVPARAKRALLAIPPGEEHALGLAMLEPVLRELGYRCDYCGRRTPAEELASLSACGRYELVAISASVCADPAALASLVAQIENALAPSPVAPPQAPHSASTLVILGGGGPWPARPASPAAPGAPSVASERGRVLRVHHFAELAALLSDQGRGVMGSRAG